MNDALKQALQEALALVDEADVRGLRGRRAPVKVEVEMEEKCPECKAGECAEHISDEDAEGMASMLGED